LPVSIGASWSRIKFAPQIERSADLEDTQRARAGGKTASSGGPSDFHVSK